MGHLVEKYTAAYFLKRDEQGGLLPYGVEGIESFEQGALREHDSEILRHVDLRGASVLEFGFGRGESIKHTWEQGAAEYVGVDFSPAACGIARDFLRKFGIEGPRIECSDALDFLRRHVESGGAKFDVVLMLDFVEHVPRSELAEILRLLRGCVKDSSVLVVNTPDFLYDNDVLTEGLNEQGADSSDGIDETRGMHCNRYTLESLRRFFLALGYAALGRGHYFVPAEPEDRDTFAGQPSYAGRWNRARARGARVGATWPREAFEIAYEVKEKPELHTFTQGNLAGLSIYVTRSYLEYYGGGNYDPHLFEFISRHQLEGKTIFDLGAFVGVNTLQFARLVGPNGRVCGFEPNPMNADRLRLNLSENPELESRVRVYPLALSNEIGSTRFSLHRNVDAGVSSASYIRGAHTTLSQETLTDLGFIDIDVQVCTIDEFVRRTGLTPSLVKIDIEGSEHLALLGGMETLRTARPALLVELHSIYCAVMVLKTVELMGYAVELLHVEEDGRCFIGASSRADASPEVRARQDQAESLKVDVFRHELERVRATLETLTRRETEANARLAEESKRLEAGRAGLKAELARLEDERAGHEVALRDSSSQREALQAETVRLEEQRAAYEAALRDCTGERDAAFEREARLASELRAEQATSASLQETVERYRRSPLIRMGLKLRGMFGR